MSLAFRRVGAIIRAVKKLAIDYYKETGKPLGVTGEIAEWEAARILKLKLCRARQNGCDAIRVHGRTAKRIRSGRSDKKNKRVAIRTSDSQRTISKKFNASKVYA